MFSFLVLAPADGWRFTTFLFVFSLKFDEQNLFHVFDVVCMGILSDAISTQMPLKIFNLENVLSCSHCHVWSGKFVLYTGSLPIRLISVQLVLCHTAPFQCKMFPLVWGRRDSSVLHYAFLLQHSAQRCRQHVDACGRWGEDLSNCSLVLCSLVPIALIDQYLVGTVGHCSCRFWWCLAIGLEAAKPY